MVVYLAVVILEMEIIPLRLIIQDNTSLTFVNWLLVDLNIFVSFAVKHSR